MNKTAAIHHLMIASSALLIGAGANNFLIGLGAWIGMVAIYRAEPTK